jgi:hypothetical protein
MAAVLCSQCSAPLSIEAIAGHVPCGFCGAVNAPPAPHVPPPMLAQVAIVYGPPAPVADTWVCPACRHENRMHYKFCLGCGVVRPEASDDAEQTYGADGNPAYARQRSPVVLVVLIVVIIVVGTIGGVAAILLAR